MTEQLQEIRRSYEYDLKNAKSEISDVRDLTKIHEEVSTRHFDQLHQLLRQAHAHNLFNTFESSLRQEMNEIFDCEQKILEARVESLKTLRTEVIPNQESAFKTKMFGFLQRDPFITTEDFEQMLADRCLEVSHDLFKQISQVVPLNSVDGIALKTKVQFSLDQIKEELIEKLHQIREEAEKSAKNVRQQVLSFALNEISNVAESLTISPTADVEAAFQVIRPTVESKFESEWPYGPCAKGSFINDIITRGLFS